MDVPRVTVEEVKARLDRGEPIAFIDARGSEAWSKSMSRSKDRFAFRPTMSASDSVISRATGASSSNARDRVRHRAPETRDERRP